MNTIFDEIKKFIGNKIEISKLEKNNLGAIAYAGRYNETNDDNGIPYDCNGCFLLDFQKM